MEKGVKNLRKLMPNEAAYIAGFLDGDGCISIYQPKFPQKSLQKRVIVSFCGKEETVMKWIADKLRIGYCGVHRRHHFWNHEYEVWQYGLGGNVKVLWLLKQVEPYLILKKEKAKEAIILIREQRRKMTNGLDIPDDFVMTAYAEMRMRKPCATRDCLNKSCTACHIYNMNKYRKRKGLPLVDLKGFVPVNRNL